MIQPLSQSTSRRRFLQAGALAASASLTDLAGKAWPAPAVAKNRPPNFLLIISDQVGHDALSGHGCPDSRTPNLDRLMSRGTSFLQSHSSNPVCSPARSSLFTGRMPTETGVIGNSRPIHPSRPNMGQWLKEAGYETIYSGKWHLPGDTPDGFKVLPISGGQGVTCDRACSRASEAYLHQRDRSRPFLQVMSLMQPHDICFWAIQSQWLVPEKLPMTELAGRLPPLPPNHRVRPVAPAWLDTVKFEKFSDQQWRHYLYAYYRQVEMMDADVGRLLDALEETGQADDTVVIFTADHGDGRGRHQMVGKGFPYDEAEKVPLIFACPDRVAQNHVDRQHHVAGIDVMGTVCELAGIRPPKITGRSLLPLLEQRDVAWREFVASEFHVQGRLLRTERFKYVRYAKDPVEQLFDMQADPWETKNLYQDAKHADVLADHRRMLAEWTSRLEPVQPTADAVEEHRKDLLRRRKKIG